MPTADRWSPRQIIKWIAITLLVLMISGPAFFHSLQPAVGSYPDFSQEWLSARNFWTQKPIYLSQAESLPLHTGSKPAKDELLLPWNAHPPFAVLLAIPFGLVDYPSAHLLWNLLSLLAYAVSVWIILREADLSPQFWSILPILALTFAFYPLLFHIAQGQLNLLLLFWITLAWHQDRRGHSLLAGLCIGIAGAIKLFPLIFLLYFTLTRQWRGVLGMAVGFASCNLIAAGMLGIQAFQDYVNNVLPTLWNYQASWRNNSLHGIWLRAFDPIARKQELLVPLVENPWLARMFSWATRASVIVLSAWVIWNSDQRFERDRAFTLLIVAMLLVAPLSWNYSFVLLILPLVWCWKHSTGAWRILMWLSLLVFLLPESTFLRLSLGREITEKLMRRPYGPVSPWANFYAFSVFCYFLLVLFMLVWNTRTKPKAQTSIADPLPPG